MKPQDIKHTHTRGLLAGRGNRITAFHPFHNYKVSILRVNKTVHPEQNMTEQAALCINSILLDVLEKLIEKMNRLCYEYRVHTVNSRHVQTATHLLFSESLAKQAMAEGTKAVTKYYQNPPGTHASGHLNRSKRAGLTLRVSVTERMLREHSKYRVAKSAGVYLTAVLEYLSAEICEIAGNAARDNKFVRTRHRDVFLAIAHDEELNKLLRDCNIVLDSNSVLPSIRPQLLPRKQQKALHAKMYGDPDQQVLIG